MKAQLISAFTAAVLALSWTGIGASADAYSEEKESVSCDIDMGGIGGTDIADNLNSHRSEIADFLNGLADKYEDMYREEIPDIKLDRLSEEDIDFDCVEKVGTFGIYIQGKDKFPCDMTYDEYLEYISGDDGDFHWEYHIYKGGSVYRGYIYEDETGSGSNSINIDGIKLYNEGIYPDIYLDNDIVTADKYITEHTSAALQKLGEKSCDIKATVVSMNYAAYSYELIIFVDGRAKYVEDTTFAVERAMCTYLRDDTPGPVREFLSQEKAKLENAAMNRNGDFALYSYNDLMKVVRASLPWVEEDYLDYLDEI